MTSSEWQRIDQLFQSALEKPRSERAAFLSELAASDPEIHSEVASLLAAHEEAAGFLSMPSLFDTQRFDTEAGYYSRIGPYQIEREIGAGGMGTVYLASRADQQFEKQVALKVVRAGLESESVLARFRGERQILAQLDHPNIARLLDGGLTPDGRPYLVMELASGVTLDRYFSDQNRKLNERLDVFSQICSAVHYAHQRLVIHRDLKPANILVDSAGTAKLLDFGIAKLLDSDQTQTRERPLTPRYASPEQQAGLPLTTASDIYALGVVLHELLTGYHPSEKPGPLRKQLPRDLDAIVQMALRPEPERRYASASQLAADISRFRQSMPVLARKETPRYVISRFFDRHRVAALAGAAVFVTLAAGVAIAGYEARIAERERTKAEYIKDFVRTTIIGASPTYESPFAAKGRDLRVADVLDAAAQRVQTELEAQPLVASELRRNLASAYARLGLNQEAGRLMLAAQTAGKKKP